MKISIDKALYVQIRKVLCWKDGLGGEQREFETGRNLVMSKAELKGNMIMWIMWRGNLGDLISQNRSELFEFIAVFNEAKIKEYYLR